MKSAPFLHTTNKTLQCCYLCTLCWIAPSIVFLGTNHHPGQQPVRWRATACANDNFWTSEETMPSNLKYSFLPFLSAWQTSKQHNKKVNRTRTWPFAPPLRLVRAGNGVYRADRRPAATGECRVVKSSLSRGGKKPTLSANNDHFITSLQRQSGAAGSAQRACRQRGHPVRMVSE